MSTNINLLSSSSIPITVPSEGQLQISFKPIPNNSGQFFENITHTSISPLPNPTHLLLRHYKVTMKFTLPLTVIAIAATAIADPAAEPEANPQWCMIRGQPCWKVKRAAEAFAESIASSGGVVEAREAEGSGLSGNAAFEAKRQVDDLALFIAAATGDPTSYYKALGLGGQFGADAKAEKSEKREAGADPQWCMIRGQPCWKGKRDAEPQWCMIRGQPCWKSKRTATDFNDPDKRWCLIRGQPCWKAKRAAEAVVTAIESTHDPRDVPFNPEARVKREAEPWCLIRGQPCWKREANAEASAEAACNAPDGACTKAKRDLTAIYLAARNILGE
jgi:hypothetical protein